MIAVWPQPEEHLIAHLRAWQHPVGPPVGVRPRWFGEVLLGVESREVCRRPAGHLLDGTGQGTGEDGIVEAGALMEDVEQVRSLVALRRVAKVGNQIWLEDMAD